VFGLSLVALVASPAFAQGGRGFGMGGGGGYGMLIGNSGVQKEHSSWSKCRSTFEQDDAESWMSGMKCYHGRLKSSGSADLRHGFFGRN
jgi:hypothetical protein